MTFQEFLHSDKSKKPHYLLIGNPIEHSVSPIMHNTALQHYNLPGEYVALSVTGNDITSLIAHCNKAEFLGANITIPHKETLFDVVDVLSDEAMEIGAINTIVKADNKLIGHNTDGFGFLAPLEEVEDELEGGRAVIFGTGGATKAIIYALQSLNMLEIVLVSRRPGVYDNDDDSIIRCNYDNWSVFAGEASIIINATPLGMHPNVNASPVRNSELEYLKGKICYDIVYNPRKTYFLQQAETAGGFPIGGLDMLIYQGAKSFKLWTGQEFPVGLVRMRLEDVFPA
ncbi:MAG: shikimate dehydrogenase [Balneolaceae bacterium]